MEPQCVESCNFVFPLSIEDFTGLWWNIHLTLSFLSVHIWSEAWCHEHSMSSASSPLVKMRKFAWFSSIHSRVWMQHGAARSGPPVLPGLINLHHHTALWKDVNSHCLVLRKKKTKFLFLSALPLASNPISVPWKVNYFLFPFHSSRKMAPFLFQWDPGLPAAAAPSWPAADCLIRAQSYCSLFFSVSVVLFFAFSSGWTSLNQSQC